jgi:hypothetical protein
MGGTSMKFVWQDISTLSAVCETICAIHDPQFDISNLDTVDIFESIFDTVIMRLTANNMNKYAQQKILKSSCSLTCHFRLKKQENITLDEMYMV